MSGKLARLQEAFQAAILTDDMSIIAALATPPSGSKEEAFEVYETAYGLRLREFLANSYPVLLAFAGEDNFDDMVQAFISACPSCHRNARWFGRGLVEYLQGCTPGQYDALWIELAEFERALDDAFDACNETVVSLDDMARHASEPGKLAFRISSSACLLSHSHNTTSLWSALSSGEEPPEIEWREWPIHVLVWRQGEQARFRLLPQDEFMLLNAAREGHSFAVMLEMLAFSQGAEHAATEAASFLRGWLASGLITGLRSRQDRQDGLAGIFHLRASEA